LPAAVPRLKAFAARLEAVGVQPEFRKTMILRWGPEGQPDWNLGTVTTAGKVWTDNLSFQCDHVGLSSFGHAYLERLASSVPEAFVKPTPKQHFGYVASKKTGTYVTIEELLAHEDEWFAAIAEFMASATDALKEQ
jgi:hypothetical protein